MSQAEHAVEQAAEANPKVARVTKKRVPAMPKPPSPPGPAMRSEPIKLRVTHPQGLLYDNVLLPQGAVFLYWHEEEPADWIAMRAEEDEQVGDVIVPETMRKPAQHLPWTTPGYKHLHATGQLPRIGQ